MTDASLGGIFLDSLLINNFVLSVFLGICPFIGVSGKLSTAWRMGVSVIFVITVSSVLAYGMNALLVRVGAEYLRIISFIVIIASTVQLVEMFIKKTSPALFRALGIYLPLITTNCAVLGVALFQTAREYSLAQSVVFAGAGADGDDPGAAGAVRHPGRGARHRARADARRHAVDGVHGVRRHGSGVAMALELIKGCLGILFFMGVWVAVQAVIRRRMAHAPDADVLDDMARGCGCCGGAASCARDLAIMGRPS
jgi:electron transport complex protein RnfA